MNKLSLTIFILVVIFELPKFVYILNSLIFAVDYKPLPIFADDLKIAKSNSNIYWILFHAITANVYILLAAYFVDMQVRINELKQKKDDASKNKVWSMEINLGEIGFWMYIVNAVFIMLVALNCTNLGGLNKSLAVLINITMVLTTLLMYVEEVNKKVLLFIISSPLWLNVVALLMYVKVNLV